MKFLNKVNKIISSLNVKEDYVDYFLTYTFFYSCFWFFYLMQGVIFNLKFNFNLFFIVTILIFVSQIGFFITCKDDVLIFKRVVASFFMSAIMISSFYVPDLLNLKLNISGLELQKTYAEITDLPNNKGKTPFIIKYQSVKFAGATKINGYLLTEIELNGKNKYYLEIFYHEINGLIYTKKIKIKKKFEIKIECNLPCDTLN
jgi:hypothetical protein